jgi:hypothetical protein
MADFRLEARTRAGLYLATLPFRDLQGEWWRNKVKQLRFTLPLHHEVVTRTNVDPGKTEVQLFRNDVRIYTGPIWNATASSGDGTLQCDSESLESYLDLRRLDQDLRYSAQPGGSVMWDLINRAQTGTDAALGFTSGTIQTAPNRTVSWLKNDGNMYGTIVSEFADNTSVGFDWEIDDQRRLQVYYPRPSTASRSKLEYGGVVTGYSLQVQGKWAANDVVIKGDEAIRSTPVIDTGRRSSYGLRQYFESNTDLTTNTAANDYAQRVLNLHRDVRTTPQVSLRTTDLNPFNGDIWFGQTAPVVIADDWTQFNQTMRCEGWQLTAGKHGNETIILYMTDMREV